MMKNIHYVQGKRRCKTKVDQPVRRPYREGRLTKRMRKANLSQRKRKSKGYDFRNERLQRASAQKSEQDLEWLDVQQRRLATIIARRDTHELLPEGAFSECVARAAEKPQLVYLCVS